MQQLEPGMNLNQPVDEECTHALIYLIALHVFRLNRLLNLLRKYTKAEPSFHGADSKVPQCMQRPILSKTNCGEINNYLKGSKITIDILYIFRAQLGHVRITLVNILYSEEDF